MRQSKWREGIRIGLTAGVLTVFPAWSAAEPPDAVLEWNAIMLSVNTPLTAGGPFNQARIAAIVQLAVFEAVNAVTHEYEPYLGTIHAEPGASAEAAAVAAAHRVLRVYFQASAGPLDAARAASLARIPDGPGKDAGATTGEAAAVSLIALRAADGSAPPQLAQPASTHPGVWQPMAGCPGGFFLHWRNVTPFGLPDVATFRADEPPALTSAIYAKDYAEVAAVGGRFSTLRPQDRTDVALFYAVTSGTMLWNQAARQIAADRGTSLSENARALALVNMAISDGAVASFETKYHYNYWRPETAIRAGDADGNAKTAEDPAFVPFIATPCFPSYPSAHASTGSAARVMLELLFGAANHPVTLSNPAVPNVTLTYSILRKITDDIDDARVYGGIHFRFDQEEGGRQGQAIAMYIIKNNLRPVHPRE
jgi:hypothetical protein